ncbi:MAG TPA: helix-turn-helix domain-containing protein [Trebonia sp.]|jgi:AcrR family transcriptional regulator|nr:helix-turn-helix domain-containing protein [Trebonia sp.]
MKSADHLIRTVRVPEPAPPAAEGLRDRKKRLTRQAIYAAADRLFAERGFGNVTVAEIADAANISVKTLFTYVGAKEELLFRGQPTVLDAVVQAVGNRRVGQTPLVAAAQALLAAVDEKDEGRSLRSFAWMVASGPAARSRIRALWDETETRLAEALSAEARGASGDSVAERAARRLTAAQIMVLVRTVTSDEVADLVAKSADADADRREALSQWIRDAAGVLARGLQSPAR